jgi:hypothetical protein
MTRLGTTLSFVLGALALGACNGGIATPTQTDPTDPGTSGGSDTTFDHENNGISIWDYLDRIATEGPPTYTSHIAGCRKLSIANLGNVLTGFGVKIPNATANSAGAIYAKASSALGAANYAGRVREGMTVTTSQASSMYDIFASAAPEIITAMAATTPLAQCAVAGAGAKLFDAAGACQIDGLTCLIGRPATQAHVDICNTTIQHASDQVTGQRIAVAALLAATYTCE